MAQGRHSAYFLACVLQHEFRLGTADLADAQLIGHHRRVHLRRAAGQYEQRFAVELENQAVGDRGHVAPQD
jgi:hypothetical protein